jgi:AcrR family transcriptional regulator
VREHNNAIDDPTTNLERATPSRRSLDDPASSVTVQIIMSQTASVTKRRAGRPRDLRLDEAILRATIELIEERGYSELTLAGIAERAGTTTPAIYRRWSSKADLVLHAVFRTEGPDVVADSGDLESDIRLMVGWTLQKLGRPAGRAALAGLLSEPALERSERLEQLAVVWRRIGERLAQAVAAGEIRSGVDTEALISVLAGPAMMAAFLHGAAGVDARWVDSVVSIVLDGIRPPRPARAARTTATRR